MKKFFKRTVIVLVCLVGLWCILLALRKPWIEPIPGVRLEPTRPILLEKDVKPDSAFDLLRRAGAECKVDSDQMNKALDEWKHMPWSLDGATNSLAILEQTQESLALARRAAEAPDPQVLTITRFDQQMHYVAKTRAIARCFNLSAKAKTVRGDYSGALGDLQNAISFSSILTRGGVTIEHLTSVACCRMSGKTMRQIALKYPVEENSLRDAIRFLEKTENELEPWAECLRHQRVDDRSYINEFFRNPTVYSLSGSSDIHYGMLRIVSPLLGSTPTTMKRDLDACFTHLITMAGNPYNDESYDHFYSMMKPSSILSLMTSKDPLGRIFAGCMLPAIGAVHCRHVFMIANLRATRIVLAVVMFKRDEGRLPQKLDELTPRYLDKIPDDPFDGKQMKYRVNPDGTWVVYSVSTDGKDDGGIEDPKQGLGKPDLIFGPTETP